MQDNDIDGSGGAASGGMTAPQTVADVLGRGGAAMTRALLAPHENAIKHHAAKSWQERVEEAVRALTKAQTASLLTEGQGCVAVRSERMGKALFAAGLVNFLPEKWDGGLRKLSPLGREVVAALRAAAASARQETRHGE